MRAKGPRQQRTASESRKGQGVARKYQDMRWQAKGVCREGRQTKRAIRGAKQKGAKSKKDMDDSKGR